MSANTVHAGCETRAWDPATISDLRRAYFAQAAEAAGRYDVCFDRIIAHLCDTRAQERVPVSAIRHVDDLVHAVACVDGGDLAWRDLADHYERALIRGCRQWMDPTEAIVFVRRLLTELRRDEGTILSLRRFDGTRSLRRGLEDRLLGRLSRAGFAFASAGRPTIEVGRAAEGPAVDRDLAWRTPG